MGITAEQIASAIEEGPSETLEVSADKQTLRRVGNPPLPEQGLRKRDQKAADKGLPAGKAKEQQEDEYDADGKVILCEKDFDNPMIIAFKAEGVEKGEEFKVEWKKVEATVKERYPGLKLVYARGDQDKNEGHLAFSQLRIKTENIEALCGEKITIQEKEHSFRQLEGEDLKEFWHNEGGHYTYCIQTRLRAAKKQAKARAAEKREGVKRAKTSYEIAGVYYLDINKVKSKTRAILNQKKDGEKLEGNDSDFIKEILGFHDKADAKLKDFDCFEVGVHPSFDKTRCYFVVRKDGTKEDFSIAKCIMKLENQS
jgi:uncharacterized protein (DUF433 family)